MTTLMQKFEGDSVHAVFNGRFEISTYFHQWERNTKGGRWELLYAKPINLVLSANMPTHYESYKDSLSESTDIDQLSSELYFHIVFSLLRKEDENLLERLKAVTSEIDKKAKTIGILKAFYFLKASQKHLFSRKDFWHCMEKGNFYDDVFSMHYLYHFIMHAGQKDSLLDCGRNFKKFFDEEEIENTLKN